MTLAVGSNITVNTFHQDHFSVVFSNIPSLTNMREMNLYNLFIRSIDLPEYTQEFVPSQFKGSTIWNPISQSNDELPSLTVEFKLSENMENYYNLFYWMQSIRYRQPNTTAVQSELIRKNTVKSIDVLLLDNQKRPRMKMSFTDAFCAGLSNLQLTMGDSSEVTFITTWKYTEVMMDPIP